VTDVHHLLGVLFLAATLGLLLASVLSVLAARRSGGAMDHRFATDRLVLVLVGVVALNGLLGLLLLAAGSRPADPLHLLYGPAALVTVPVAVWLSRRGGRASTPVPGRRDAWMAVGAIALIGLAVRLFMTG